MWEWKCLCVGEWENSCNWESNLRLQGRLWPMRCGWDSACGDAKKHGSHRSLFVPDTSQTAGPAPYQLSDKVHREISGSISRGSITAALTSVQLRQKREVWSILAWACVLSVLPDIPRSNPEREQRSGFSHLFYGLFGWMFLALQEHCAQSGSSAR